MEKQEVIDLMKSSKTEKEWNDNCDKVKSSSTTGREYPDFWYDEIIVSGMFATVENSWA